MLLKPWKKQGQEHPIPSFRLAPAGCSVQHSHLHEIIKSLSLISLIIKVPPLVQTKMDNIMHFKQNTSNTEEKYCWWCYINVPLNAEGAKQSQSAAACEKQHCSDVLGRNQQAYKHHLGAKDEKDRGAIKCTSKNVSNEKRSNIVTSFNLYKS